MPIITETCVPTSTRLKMSRPRLSPPRTYAQLPPSAQAGGMKRVAISWCAGSVGALSGASSATVINRARMTKPVAPFALERSASRKRLPARSGGAAAVSGAGAGARSTDMADPRVGQAVEDVDHQVDGEKQDRGDQHHRLD